jgi:hypothetical protein
VLQLLGQFDDAERCHRDALRIRKKVIGEGHPDYALSLNNLGCVLRAKGDKAGALSQFEQVLRVIRNERDPLLSTTLLNMGTLLLMVSVCNAPAPRPAPAWLTSARTWAMRNGHCPACNGRTSWR